MPFNMAVASGGRTTFILDPLVVEDLMMIYDVESQVVSKFGVATKAGDLIVLTLGAVDFVASISTGYAIDADGVHDEALFRLTLTTGCQLFGRGGSGGKGGNGFWEPEPAGWDDSRPGVGGDDGGTAIRYGCPTEIIGTGLISKGYGAGGGGGGGASGPGAAYGGGGGGGGMPLGWGGTKGSGINGDGVNGDVATISALGSGGAAGGAAGGDGGDGGDDTPTTQENGQNGGAPGGTAGDDGDAIDTQTFSHSAEGGITITGDVV